MVDIAGADFWEGIQSTDGENQIGDQCYVLNGSPFLWSVWLPSPVMGGLWQVMAHFMR